jgi:cAMP-dependent protein kinase regulator
MRTSVSAEVYGQFNRKEVTHRKFILKSFKARFIEKSQEQKDRIITRLMQSFMFSALDDKERDIVVNAMEEKKFKFSI